MKNLDDQSADAAGTLRIALHRMADSYPFHANLLSEGRFEANVSIKTMAVTVRAGRITFLYSPRFVTRCSLPELAGVLHHELNHVLFGHIFADPVRYPDRNARLISEEVTVNEWVREPLPGVPVTLDQFPALPPGEDTETRYRRLAQTEPKCHRDVPKPSSHVPKNGSPRTVNGSVCTGNLPIAEPLDDHRVWAEARQDPTIASLAVAVEVRKAQQRLTPEQWNALPEQLRSQIVRLTRGSIPGQVEEVFTAGLTPRKSINWRRLLHRYVARIAEERPVFNRPPRRFPHLVGVLPGRGRRNQRPRIMAVIDTSGSVTTSDLYCISAELARFAPAYEVVVVECDAAVQAVYAYRQPIRKVCGRGGTDFRPVFAVEFLRKHKPDVLIYFTDGNGKPPTDRPNLPVIWCLTSAGEKPTDWGHVVRMATLS